MTQKATIFIHFLIICLGLTLSGCGGSDEVITPVIKVEPEEEESESEEETEDGEDTETENEASKIFPTDLIPSLVEWKITLPVDIEGNDNSAITDVNERNNSPWEIEDEELIGFEYTPYFLAKDGEVIFRGHCAGTTTRGSKYPRSELRQRVGGGNNYWSMDKPQYLETEVRVLHVPEVKPEVCMVQIHGPDDEPLRVQYHASEGVYIVWNEDNKDTDNAMDYALGERLKIAVTVDKGDITCQIDNLDRNTSYTKTWTSIDKTGYFKVGCYTQSSIFLSQIKSGSQNEPLDAYGEVAVKSIRLEETYE